MKKKYFLFIAFIMACNDIKIPRSIKYINLKKLIIYEKIDSSDGTTIIRYKIKNSDTILTQTYFNDRENTILEHRKLNGKLNGISIYKNFEGIDKQVGYFKNDTLLFSIFFSKNKIDSIFLIPKVKVEEEKIKLEFEKLPHDEIFKEVSISIVYKLKNESNFITLSSINPNQKIYHIPKLGLESDTTAIGIIAITKKSKKFINSIYSEIPNDNNFEQ